MNQWKRDRLCLGGCWILTVMLFFSPVAAWAAEPATPVQGTTSAPPAGAKVLMLDEAVRIALENHPSIKSAEQQIGAQQAVVGQQLAAYYPTVSFNNSYSTRNTTGTASIPSKSFDFVSSAANINMTLYNFGKREGTVESARDTLEATQYAYKAAANNVVLAVKQAYYGVLQANALLKVNEETVKDREVTLRQTQGFYDVGTRPRSDVTQAQANLYTARANLITAQNGVSIAWTTLKNAMGLDELSEQPLGEQLAVTPIGISLDEAKQAAFAARPELLQFAAQLKAQDQQLAVARRNHLPDILFSSSYGRQNSDASNGLFPLRPSWQVQVSFNIPIFNGFQTTYQAEQALYTYNSIKEQERLQRQQVALQVEQSYLNLTAAAEVVKANDAAVKAAKENLDLQEGRYQVGVGSIVEVTDAQTTYTNAETNYVNALASYKVAQAQLLNAMGRQ